MISPTWWAMESMYTSIKICQVKLKDGAKPSGNVRRESHFSFLAINSSN